MDTQIPGVTVRVIHRGYDGTEIPVADDGYLGRLTTHALELHIRVEQGYRIDAFLVDGNKNVVAKKNLIEQPGSNKLYELTIPVHQKGTQSGFYVTYPTNNLRLAEQKETGTVQLWEIAVISQNGDFFLTIQPTYRVECYRHGNIIVYPYFEKWLQMNDYLVSLLPSTVQPGPLDDYKVEPPLSTNGYTDNEAIVQWFNDAQGLGALVTNKGVARVHWGQVPKRGRRAYLRPGEKVRFQELKPPTQTTARSTRFKWEATGVTFQ